MNLKNERETVIAIALTGNYLTKETKAYILMLFLSSSASPAHKAEAIKQMEEDGIKVGPNTTDIPEAAEAMLIAYCALRVCRELPEEFLTSNALGGRVKSLKEFVDNAPDDISEEVMSKKFPTPEMVYDILDY